MELGLTHRPLGVVLVERGLVTDDDVVGALAVQVETSQPLGEILVQRALIARPSLARALAAQEGVSLEEEGGFGTGLMAKIEHLHRERRGLTTAAHGDIEAQEEPDSCEPPAFEISPQEHWEDLLRKREHELDERERELAQREARLNRKERTLPRKSANAA